jgi:hypothetical protein
LLSPKVFFSNMPVSGGFPPPVMFYVVIAAINAIFTLLFGLAHPIAALLFTVQFFILMIVSSFVGAAVVMAISRVLGGTGDYEATYRAVAYAAAPHIVSWIPLIGVASGLYSLFLLKLGLERAQNLPSNKAVAVVAIQVGLVLIVMVVGMFLGLAALLGARN